MGILESGDCGQIPERTTAGCGVQPVCNRRADCGPPPLHVARSPLIMAFWFWSSPTLLYQLFRVLDLTVLWHLPPNPIRSSNLFNKFLFYPHFSTILPIVIQDKLVSWPKSFVKKSMFSFYYYFISVICYNKDYHICEHDSYSLWV